MNRPIHVHARHLVAENTVFSVYFDHVADALGGNVVPRYLSVFPKHANQDGLSGVAVLPVIDGRLGLIRIFRHPLGRWSWEVPKGFIDERESVEAAARRELIEETGLQVASGVLQKLCVVAPEPGVIAGRISVFVADLGASGATPSVAATDELGHGELLFHDRREIQRLIMNHDVEDACTLSAILVYLTFYDPVVAPPSEC
ncbi:MAG: NUDIX hydrolase [Gammaproteobacteria bacterium]|nr:NUDIX hydrolase [Gammaproteobacteria bacterium]